MASVGDVRQDCCGFSCLGEVSINDLHKASLSNMGSYLRNFEIKSRNVGATNTTDSSFTFVNLFGSSILKSSIFEREVLEHLMMMSKREILSLKTTASQWQTVTKKFIDFGLKPKYTMNIHRQNILNFLSIIKSSLHNESFVKGLENEERNILAHVLYELKELSICCGRISSIPDHTLQSSLEDSLGNSLSHQYFHALLDIWCNVLICVRRIQEISTHQIDSYFVENISSLPLNCRENNFTQISLLLMWDLTSLAYKKFAKVKHSSDYCRVVPFHCSCFRDIWALLIQLLNEGSNDESFWKYWFFISQDLIAKREPEDETLDEDMEDSISLSSFNLKPISAPESSVPHFSLWMLTNLAELFRFDSKEGLKVRSNYVELNKLIEMIINYSPQERLTRASLSKNEDLDFALKSCLNLSASWEPNVELLVLWTDYFLKNLNDVGSSNIASMNLQTLISKTGLHWFAKIKEYQNIETSHGSKLPFQLYLSLLFSHFSQITMTNKKQVSLRRITGRIFPKISEKFIRELSQIGLENFLTLQLFLGYVGSVKDVTPKLCAISRMIPVSPLVKKNVYWNALFACFHIHQEKGEDACLVAKTLCQQFTAVFELYVSSNVRKKDGTSFDLMNQIVKYLEGMRDVMSNSPSLALSEHFLINETFLKLLPQCGYIELTAALNVVEQCLLKLRNIQVEEAIDLNESQTEVLNKIEQYVAPFLNQHAATQTPPKQIASVAVELTLLYMACNWEKCMILVNNYGLNSKINAQVNSMYLCNILAKSEISNRLSEQQQELALAIWLRSSLVKPDMTKCQFVTLTRLIFSLSSVQNIFPNPLEENYDCNNSLEESQFIVTEFFRLIYVQWDSKSLRERLEFKRRLIDALKMFVNEVKGCINSKDGSFSNDATLNQIFILSSELILHLGPILYNDNSNYITILLDNTVLSLFLIKDKQEIPTVILNSCITTLPTFITGLARLGLEGIEQPYIPRKLKDIITNYVPRFPLKSGSQSFSQNHFILSALFHHKNPNFTDNSDKLFKFTMETIYYKFLEAKGSVKSPHFFNAMALSLRIFELSSGENKAWLLGKLFTSILEHLLSPTNGTKTFSLLGQLLNSILKPTEEFSTQKSIVVQCLENFIEKNLAFYSKYVFQLMEDILVIVGPEIMGIILPTLTKNIEITERKRGTGTDLTLRKGLEKFYQKLSACASKNIKL